MVTKKSISNKRILRRALPTEEEMEKIIDDDNMNISSSNTKSIDEKKALQRYIGGDSSVSPMSSYSDHSDVLFF